MPAHPNGMRRPKDLAESRENLDFDTMPQQKQKPVFQQHQQQHQHQQHHQQQAFQPQGQGRMSPEEPMGGFADARIGGGRVGHAHGNVHGAGMGNGKWGQGPMGGAGGNGIRYDRSELDRLRCKDCGAPVAWRNVDDTQSRGVYVNQEERDVQAKMLELLAAGGMSLAEISDLIGAGGGGNASLVVPTGSLNVPADARMIGGAAAGIRGAGVDRSTLDRMPKPAVWLAAKYVVEDEKREWFFYNRNKHQPFVASNYCEEHTCRHFFSQEKCMFMKAVYDEVCNQHAICPVYDCHEGKGQYVDKQRADHVSMHLLRRAFCSKHLCATEGCELMCDDLGNGIYGRFCAMHRCQYRGCDRPSLNQRPFCTKHKCQTVNCQKLSVVGFELCKIHIVCNEKGCAQPRFPLPETYAVKASERADCAIEVFDRRLYLAYCKEHGFCANRPCQGLRAKSSVHCRRHACSERGCTDVCSDKLVRYCDTHRCDMDGCTSPKAWQNDQRTPEAFCGAHVCRESSCSAGVPDLHLYCEDHECEEPGCTAETADNGVCIEHAKLRLKQHVKDAARKETGEWMHMLYAYPPGEIGGGGLHQDSGRRSRRTVHGRAADRRSARRYPSPSPSDTVTSDDEEAVGQTPSPRPGSGPGMGLGKGPGMGGPGMGGSVMGGPGMGPGMGPGPGRVNTNNNGNYNGRPAGPLPMRPAGQVPGKPGTPRTPAADSDSETDWQQMGTQN